MSKTSVMYKQIIIAVVTLLLPTNCGQENAAREQLKQATALYENRQFAAAKNLIDSINEHYPREIAVRKEALTLMRLVERGESEQNIAFCDSLLPIRIGEFERMKKDFILEKDTAYNPVGNYVLKAMTVERNVERSYIRCGVDEEGEMYMASVYFGSASIEHTGLRLSAPDGTFAQTPSIPYDGGLNYRFKDLGNTTEVVTYKGEHCQSVANFVYIIDPKERIKAEYTGGKSYYVNLSDRDRKAIRATYELALLLSEITSMQKAKTQAEKRIQRIDGKLNQ